MIRPDNPCPCEDAITETILADGTPWKQGDWVWFAEWEADEEEWLKWVNGEPIYYPATCQPFACIDDRGDAIFFIINESGGTESFMASGSFSTKEGCEAFINKKGS